MVELPKLICKGCGSSDFHIEKEYYKYCVKRVLVCNKCGCTEIEEFEE